MLVWREYISLNGTSLISSDLLAATHLEGEAGHRQPPSLVFLCLGGCRGGAKDQFHWSSLEGLKYDFFERAGRGRTSPHHKSYL